MDTTREGQVIGVMNAFLADWAARDIDTMMAYLSPDVTLYGTGQDEKRVGKAEVRFQIERDFAQSDALSCELTWSHVGMSDTVAWVASDVMLRVSVADQGEMAFPARLSTVWQDHDGRWLVEHMHLSVAAGNQEEGKSF